MFLPFYPPPLSLSLSHTHAHTHRVDVKGIRAAKLFWIDVWQREVLWERRGDWYRAVERPFSNRPLEHHLLREKLVEAVAPKRAPVPVHEAMPA